MAKLFEDDIIALPVHEEGTAGNERDREGDHGLGKPVEKGAEWTCVSL